MLGVTLAATAIASARWLRVVPAMVRDAFRELLASHSPGWARACALIALVVLLLCLLAFTLPPTVDWDSLAYHLQVPAEWLAVDRVHLPADNNHVAFVGAAHMLYLPLLALGLTSGPALLSAVLAVAAGVAVYAAARDVFSPRTGAVAFWLWWASPIVLLTAVTPRVDVSCALLVVAAHHALLIGYRERERRRAWLAAVLLGVAFGVKYVAWLVAFSLLPLAIAMCVRSQLAEPKKAWRDVALFGGLVLVA